MQIGPAGCCVRRLSGTCRALSGACRALSGARQMHPKVHTQKFNGHDIANFKPRLRFESRSQTFALGQDGGSYESVACDNTDPLQPVFYLTEGDEAGALQRYSPDQHSGWNTLHEEDVGTFDYLEFLDEMRFNWTNNLEAARKSQKTYYSNVEGIDYYNGEYCTQNFVELRKCQTKLTAFLFHTQTGNLYFVSKTTRLLYTINLVISHTIQLLLGASCLAMLTL